jgi:hypothetical protein
MPHCLDLRATSVSTCPMPDYNCIMLASSPLEQSRRSEQQGRGPCDQHSA